MDKRTHLGVGLDRILELGVGAILNIRQHARRSRRGGERRVLFARREVRGIIVFKTGVDGSLQEVGGLTRWSPMLGNIKA